MPSKFPIALLNNLRSFPRNTRSSRIIKKVLNIYDFQKLGVLLPLERIPYFMYLGIARNYLYTIFVASIILVHSSIAFTWPSAAFTWPHHPGPAAHLVRFAGIKPCLEETSVWRFHLRGWHWNTETSKAKNVIFVDQKIKNQLGKTWNHLAIPVLLEYSMSWASFVKILGEWNVLILGFWIRSSLGICWSRLWNMGFLLISPGKVPVFSMVLPCFAKPWIYIWNLQLMNPRTANFASTYSQSSWWSICFLKPMGWCRDVNGMCIFLFIGKYWGNVVFVVRGLPPRQQHSDVWKHLELRCDLLKDLCLYRWWNFNSFRMSGTHRDVNHMTIHPVWQIFSYLAWSQKNTHSKHFRKAMNVMIDWVWPLPSNSDHQDYRILVGNPYKPLFVTVTGRGPYPIYHHVHSLSKMLWMCVFLWPGQIGKICQTGCMVMWFTSRWVPLILKLLKGAIPKW